MFDERAKLPLASIRRLLGALIDENTILVGHGLENDLKAMRMIHPRVIDTIALFPHALGFPYRRALRDLYVNFPKITCVDSLYINHTVRQKNFLARFKRAVAQLDIRRSRTPLQHSTSSSGLLLTSRKSRRLCRQCLRKQYHRQHLLQVLLQ
jgi:hypothetical protein